MNTAIVMNYSHNFVECTNVKKKGRLATVEGTTETKKNGNPMKKINLRPP